MSQAPEQLPRSGQPDVVPEERARFRQLLAANPNHFGNLAESQLPPVTKIVADTRFEEVTCVGLNIGLDQLEATVAIKRPFGYGGDLCGGGSTEYVRFYLDYGAGWTDAGMAAFGAHDIPDGTDCAKAQDKPLTYAVTLPIQPRRSICVRPVLPNVRAILSWNLPPPAGAPGWRPVWGGVRDQHVQVRPRPLVLSDVVELVDPDALEKLPPLVAEAPPLPIPLPDPPPLSLERLAGAYRDQRVPPHRFGLAHLQTAVAGAVDQEALGVAYAEWQTAGLDLQAALDALDATGGDVSFEELECLALDGNVERLVATLRVKRPTGYSGGLCSRGSREYVAFWADWEDRCRWTHLGTVAVAVHDIPSIPADGLAYSVVLPVDLDEVRRPCDAPRVARVRAVLSWNVPPSSTDPNAGPVWGNRVDAHVQIRPGARTGGGPLITAAGGIGLHDIDVFGGGLTLPPATFAFGGTAADPWGLGRPCPFGGLVIVQGPPRVGHQYRLLARRFGQPGTESPVTNPIHVVDVTGAGSTRTPDPGTGYLAYVGTLSNMDNVLAHWTPPGDELWEIRLEMATLAGAPEGTTPWYRIQLDNTAPRRRPAAQPFEPPPVTCHVQIDSGGDCKDFVQGTAIQGHFVAQDAHFGAFGLTTLPSTLNPPQPATATPATSPTASFAAGGDAWTLDTTGMTPCGYVVLLQVSDRAIVNSVPGQHNYDFADVGFCLRQP